MALNARALAEWLLHRHRHLHVQLHLLLLVLFANAILPVQSFSVDTATTSNAGESKKLQLFPYQEKGVDRLCSDRRLILGDVPLPEREGQGIAILVFSILLTLGVTFVRMSAGCPQSFAHRSRYQRGTVRGSGASCPNATRR